MIYVLFYSVSDALYFERMVKNDNSFTTKIVPVPRALSSSCGYSAEVTETTYDVLRKFLDEHEIEEEAIYSAILDGKNYKYELL